MSTQSRVPVATPAPSARAAQPRLGEGAAPAQQPLFGARPAAQSSGVQRTAAPAANVAPRAAQAPNRASQPAAPRPPTAAPQQPVARPAGAIPGQPSLRPYQREADAAIEHDLAVRRLRSTMYVAATGTGKTLIIASRVRRVKTHGGRVLVIAHRDELLGQIEKKLEDVGISSDREQGKHRASTTAKVVVASVQTLRGARLKRWPHDHFAEIIVDECFPAGTLVDGRPIESLRAGDLVCSYNHETGVVELRPITRTFVSQPAALVTVHLDDGRAITCTAGHPFATPGGYVPALHLEPGDQLYGDHSQDVRGVRRAVHAALLERSNDADLLGAMQAGEARRSPQDCDDALHGVRHDDDADRAAAGRGGQAEPGLLLADLPRSVDLARQLGTDDAHESLAGSRVERADARRESDARRRRTAADAANPARAASPAADSRWERDGAEPDGAAAARCAAAGLDLQPGSADEAAPWQRLPLPLQARPSATRDADRGGDRRDEPRPAEPSRAGREEAGVARVARVARVEVHERRGGDGFGALCPGDRVHNVEVDGNHNYFVGPIGDGILVHNCHHSPAPGYVAIFDHLPDAKILGVTATPLRADGKPLGDIFESVAYRYEILRGIREKYLVPIVARYIEIESVDLNNVAVRAGDFAIDQLAAVMEDERAILGTVIPLLELAGDRSAVVFGVNVEHAHALADRINALRPGAARAVSGETDEDERRELLAAFDRGEFQFLCNCALLMEGWDSARVSCVAMARPTKSWALAVQCIGRGLRLFGATYAESIRNGKFNCLVLNFAGRSKHRLIGPADCLAGSEQGAAAIADDVAAEVNRLLGTQQLDLEKVLAIADEAVGKRRVSLAKHALVRYHAEHIDPFVGPDPGGDGQVELGWADRPPTEAQQKALDRQGVTLSKLPPSFTMADASKLLSRLAARRRAGRCSLAQAKAIAQGTGIDTRAITFDRATELCAMLRENGWRPHALRHTPEWRAAHPSEQDQPVPSAETVRVLRSLAEDNGDPAPAPTSTAAGRTFRDELVGKDGTP